jgi:hypothetical protein
MLQTEPGRTLVSSLPEDRLLTESDGPFTSQDGAPARPRARSAANGNGQRLVGRRMHRHGAEKCKRADDEQVRDALTVAASCSARTHTGFFRLRARLRFASRRLSHSSPAATSYLGCFSISGSMTLGGTCRIPSPSVRGACPWIAPRSASPSSPCGLPT